MGTDVYLARNMIMPLVFSRATANSKLGNADSLKFDHCYVVAVAVVRLGFQFRCNLFSVLSRQHDLIGFIFQDGTQHSQLPCWFWP